MARTIIFAQNASDTDLTPDGSRAPLRYPQNRLSFADEGARTVTWTLQIVTALNVSGAWTVDARFVAGVHSTGGPYGSAPTYFPFDAYKTASAVAEGAGWHHPDVPAPATAGDWGTVASNALTSTFMSRTVTVQEPQHYVEFRLTATSANGTAPPIARFVLLAETHD